ncbi:3-oxoacyl-ACP synthase III family protein [Ichthyobacterium seriolicida]|uniref:3-oxoacyl-[acyl-carrier-protein] synthase III n=1 Tax=Ichthyobacterium seriolicida TaxID=242600 RepID=A0A1J1DXF3_9FLAO|nr:ketoacyl-ACP synthase III [Ichthyobacterium seriolicida]BAV94535.1 3-oxoacyl-[acyl-carrier-protein] synthase III [Ichthyobacterium seriolicida]
MPNINAIISGTGHYLPEVVIKNNYFINSSFHMSDGTPIETPVDKTVKKLEDITGIKERRYIKDDQVNSDIAAIAGNRALEDAGINPEDLEYIIVAHNFGDIQKEVGYSDLMPSVSSRVKNKMGIKNPLCIPYDMIFGCPGWVQGVIMANQFIKAKQAKNILVIGSDTMSRLLDPHDRDSMIFSDGAGAVVISAQESNTERGIITHNVICNQREELNYLYEGASFNKDFSKQKLMIHMMGRKIYEYALTNIPIAVKSMLDSVDMHIDDISKMLIHQANAKMDSSILKILMNLYGKTTIPEYFMPMIIEKTGNSSVATVPTMLDMILKGSMPNHEIKEGDNIIFTSVGAGMFINSILYKM